MTPDDALDELYGIANRAYPQDDDLAAHATNTLSDWMNTVEAELDRLRAVETRAKDMAQVGTCRDAEQAHDYRFAARYILGEA